MGSEHLEETGSKPPAFCPACGTKVRRSIAERLGIKPDDFAIIVGLLVVLGSIVLITATITAGVVYDRMNRRAHEAEMAQLGYVQQTKNLGPAKEGYPNRDVTEWVKEDKK